MCPTTSQNPRWHPPWLSDACATRKDSESESLAKYNPETNNNTLDCKPQGRAVLPGSFNTPALPGCPFPVKALALSAHVSPQTIRFLVLDKTHFWALEGVLRLSDHSDKDTELWRRKGEKLTKPTINQL